MSLGNINYNGNHETTVHLLLSLHLIKILIEQKNASNCLVIALVHIFGLINMCNTGTLELCSLFEIGECRLAFGFKFCCARVISAHI